MQLNGLDLKCISSDLMRHALSDQIASWGYSVPVVTL